MKNTWIALAGALVLLGAGIGIFAWHGWALAPTTASVEEAGTVATTTPSATSTPATPITVPKPFPINSADTIASWDFTGAYTASATLSAQARADKAHLSGLLGTGAYDDYDLTIGMGDDDVLLGNGRGAYDEFNAAARIHPTKALAYLNLANLFDLLGGYHTAADAYAKAVAVQPGTLENHIDRLKYLTMRFPKDTAAISAAFADASAVFGDTAPILTIEGTWLEGQGRYADALKAFEAAKALSPGQDTSAIDAQIAQLQAKQ